MRVKKKAKAKVPVKTGRYANRRREPFFLLDAKQKKFLTANSKDCLISSATPSVAKKSKSTTSSNVSEEVPEANVPDKAAVQVADIPDSGRTTPPRRAPQKWTAAGMLGKNDIESG